MTDMQVLPENVPALHALATLAAQQATQEILAKYGDRDCCGFAWVTVIGVKGSTRLGKALMKVGFRKEYGGGLQLWNPSGSYTQAITAKEYGAQAYAKVLVENGIKAYANSRLD